MGSWFYFVFDGNFQVQAPQGGYIWRGDLTEGFLCYELGGLIFGGAYFRSFTVYSPNRTEIWIFQISHATERLKTRGVIITKCKVACELEKVLFPDKRNISLPYIFCNEKVHVSSAHVHRAFSLRACLHRGGGPQVGEVTRLCGVTRLSI